MFPLGYTKFTYHDKFKVLTAVLLRIHVFCDACTCSLVRTRHSKRSWCHNLQNQAIHKDPTLKMQTLKSFILSATNPITHDVLDVRGSVHHSIIHIKNPTRCNSVSKFYFIFIWSSTCFGRHTAHHQEPKTALAASGFAYMEACWTCSCWMLSASSNYTSNNPPRMQKPAAASAVLGSWWWAVCCLKHAELHINMK